MRRADGGLIPLCVEHGGREGGREGGRKGIVHAVPPIYTCYKKKGEAGRSIEINKKKNATNHVQKDRKKQRGIGGQERRRKKGGGGRRRRRKNTGGTVHRYILKNM